MDSSQPNQSIVNRFVSGFKEKTVKLAESKLAGVFTEEVPDEAILGFVASAVVLGAQRLEVRVQANDLILTHDGRKLTEAEATNLHRGVQSSPREPDCTSAKTKTVNSRSIFSPKPICVP